MYLILVVGSGGISGCAQGLLALCSRATPGSAKEPICSAEAPAGIIRMKALNPVNLSSLLS